MESFDNSAKNSLSFLDNQYVSAGVVLLLILYAGMAAPRLPKCIRNIFDYTLFKLVFFFLVAYMFMVNRDPVAALIAAVAILIVLQAFNISSTMEPMSSLSEEGNGSYGWVCACGRMHSPMKGNGNSHKKHGVSLSEEEHKLVQEGKQMMMDGKKLIMKGRSLVKNGNNGGEQLINDGKALMNAGKMQIKSVVQRRNPVSEEAMNMMEEGRQMMEEGQQLMEEGRTEEGQQLMEEAQQLVEESQRIMEEGMQMGEENTMETEFPMRGGVEMEETQQFVEENAQEMSVEEIKGMMEEGKQMMEEGRRLIQEEGRTEEGKQLMEEGRSLVEEIKQMIEEKRSEMEMEVSAEMPSEFIGGMDSLPEESLSELSEMEAEQASMEERVSMVVEEVNKQRKRGKKLNKNQIKALCSRVNDEFNFDKPTLVELWKQYRPALIQPEIPPNGIIEGGMPGSASGSQYAAVMN
ncbi:MAG: hypothetical protein Terrestrivirus3_130 [Terrestrivirus sp.]|uniref:Uncharacterized protein n=1 Tax=Terrestrivirus sp. TaxID=2487775 RepID=A0A3G4ZPH6_9VIRU|nr:MAG: hypothetical protein Terrestrivirus3_130 [Terrestrivirus sp.]